ncbi:hypothetical protein SAMN05444972_11913 [Marininema halotolerans]|uniref:Uncharacterized protein n=1 Tax=Marininema halotolerans TaxID=1155944 RepID=A0A1I6UQN8_9BACL|nr:hypothetical protein SAMN05444972_11913 [Marininema halotolerans]
MYLPELEVCSNCGDQYDANEISEGLQRFCSADCFIDFHIPEGDGIFETL